MVFSIWNFKNELLNSYHHLWFTLGWNLDEYWCGIFPPSSCHIKGSLTMRPSEKKWWHVQEFYLIHDCKLSTPTCTKTKSYDVSSIEIRMFYFLKGWTWCYLMRESSIFQQKEVYRFQNRPLIYALLFDLISILIGAIVFLNSVRYAIDFNYFAHFWNVNKLIHQTLSIYFC